MPEAIDFVFEIEFLVVVDPAIVTVFFDFVRPCCRLVIVMCVLASLLSSTIESFGSTPPRARSSSSAWFLSAR